MNDEALVFLQTLADKLGVATDVLWGALLTQAKVDSVVSLMTWCVFAALEVVLCVKLLKHKQWPESMIFVGGLSAISIGLTLAITLASLPQVMAGFVNPEYWALKEILK